MSDQEKTNLAEKEVSQAIALYDGAKKIQVITADDYTNAGQILKEVKGKSKQLDELRKSMTRPLDDSKKKIMEFFRPAEEKLAEAARIISKPMIEWETQQERNRREAERIAQEEAQKRAEEEALQLAVEVEQSGDTELAEQIISQPVQVPVVKIASAVPKTNGTFSRETWKAEVVDIKALASAVASGKVPAEALQANMPFLNQMARSFKGGLNYPGVRAIAEKSITSRA